jgi:hypothetical protein
VAASPAPVTTAPPQAPTAPYESITMDPATGQAKMKIDVTRAAGDTPPPPEGGMQKTGQGLSMPASTQGLSILKALAGERTAPAGPPGHALSVGGYNAPAPGAGAAAGGMLGAVIPEPLKAPAAAILSAGGFAAEKKIRGEPVEPMDLVKEAIMSFVPEVLESTVRGASRALGRISRGGQELRVDEAARRAAVAAPQIFQAPEREAVRHVFELVRQSGVRMDTAPIAQEVRTLTAGKYDELLSEIRRVDNVHKTGGRYEQLVTNLRRGTGPQITGYDIGDLQQLHSTVRQRTQGLASVEARQLLQDFNASIDTAIQSGLTRGGTAAGNTPQLLQEARRNWARVRAAEDLGELLTTSPVSKITGNGDRRAFYMDRLLNLLNDNDSQLARSVNRSMGFQPEAQQRFQAFVQELRDILPGKVLEISDVSALRRFAPVAAVDRALSYLLTSPTGQMLFRNAIVEGRGMVSMNTVAELVNATRRAEYGAGVDPRTAPQQ